MEQKEKAVTVSQEERTVIVSQEESKLEVVTKLPDEGVTTNTVEEVASDAPEIEEGGEVVATEYVDPVSGEYTRLMENMIGSLKNRGHVIEDTPFHP